MITRNQGLTMMGGCMEMKSMQLRRDFQKARHSSYSYVNIRSLYECLGLVHVDNAMESHHSLVTR